MAINATHIATDLHDSERVVELTGRLVRPLRTETLPIPAGGLPSDHPALRLLREVAELRLQVEARDRDLAAAYERECELVRVLHRYVIREQHGAD